MNMGSLSFDIKVSAMLGLNHLETRQQKLISQFEYTFHGKLDQLLIVGNEHGQFKFRH